MILYHIAHTLTYIYIYLFKHEYNTNNDHMIYNMQIHIYRAITWIDVDDLTVATTTTTTTASAAQQLSG